MAPVADIFLTVASGISFYFANRGYRESPGDDERNVMIGSSVLGVTFATSAVFGHIWERRCRRLKDHYEQRQPVVDTEPPAADTEPPAAIADGEVGGACHGNLTCNDGAYCERKSRTCRPGNRGRPGGECYADGTCAVDAVCEDGRCRAPELPQCRTDQHCPLGTRCDQRGQCAPVEPSE